MEEDDADSRRGLVGEVGRVVHTFIGRHERTRRGSEFPPGELRGTPLVYAAVVEITALAALATKRIRAEGMRPNRWACGWGPRSEEKLVFASIIALHSELWHDEWHTGVSA